jgi:hypothetical protein
MQLAGVVYLYDISQPPISQTDRRDREIFQKLCGDDALSSVIVGATKGEFSNHEAVATTEGNLDKILWEGTPLNGRSTVHRFQNTHDCAWEIINQLAQKGIESTVLHIQRELVDFGKLSSDTEAGKRLRHSLEDKHNMHHYVVKISLVRRILMFFGVAPAVRFFDRLVEPIISHIMNYSRTKGTNEQDLTMPA